MFPEDMSALHKYAENTIVEEIKKSVKLYENIADGDHF